MTFREFAEVYKERHAIAKGLSLARTIDWRLRPLLERFGDRALADMKTADVEDFIADLRKPRIVGREPVPRSSGFTCYVAVSGGSGGRGGRGRRPGPAEELLG